MHNLTFWVIVALIVFALLGLAGIVGSFDVEEAERQQEEYCANVKAGIWPAYRGPDACDDK